MVASISLSQAAILTAALMGGLHGPAPVKRELTPADALATTRVMQNQASPGYAIDDDLTSPDRKRYVLRTAYGDAQRNGVWVDLWTGSLESLGAATPRRCAHLFTTGLGSPGDDQGANWDPHPANLLHWMNDQEVAFLWADTHGVRQVMSVDLVTCRRRYLTHGATSVYAFAAGAGGALLIDKRLPRRARTPVLRWEHGFTLPESADAWAVLRDDIEGGSMSAVEFDTTWSIQSRRGVQPLKIAGASIDGTNPALRPLVVSPNRRYAITHMGLNVLPEEWHAYSDAFLQSLFAINRDDPDRIPVIFSVIDIQRHDVHPLWSAPRGNRSQIAWSPDSDAVLLAPTFLPMPATDLTALSGTAAAVINVQSGDSQRIPIDLTARAVVRMTWTSSNSLEIRSADLNGGDPKIEHFRHIQGKWVQDSAPLAPLAPQSLAPIQIQIRQSLNTPPTVWGVDPQGGERLLIDLNPHLLERFKLGRVERRSGVLPNGHPWLAQLIYPADYEPGKHYPMVIQCLYGKSWGEEEFTLDGTWGGSGMGLGPSAYPSYPGQLLATRDIAVLQLELLHPFPGVKEAADHQLAFETLAQQMSTSDLADASKIALVGFSRNGYWVEYTLAHTRFPFVAAIAADNYDPSYFQSALADWRPQDAEMNGAPAFGVGLQEWLAQAPGFNAEHIHTPLRMMGQVMGGIPYVIASWEIYSRLRHLKRPVEISVMPDINRHPSHNTQNPRQIMAIQESAIDWLSFWLTGREDSISEKAEQYARWHRFRQMQASSNP